MKMGITAAIVLNGTEVNHIISSQINLFLAHFIPLKPMLLDAPVGNGHG